MKISTPPSPSVAHAPRVQQGNLLQSLQVGQVLKAQVLEALNPNLLRLGIGKEQVLARNPGGLAAGQKLDLTVRQLQPQVQLQLAGSVGAESARVTLLREALPQQRPLGQVFQQLAGQLAQAPGSAASVSTALRALLQQALPLGQLNAAAVQSALQQSGALFESKLLGKQNTNADSKGRLLSLLGAARHLSDGPWARALLPLLEAALARIVMHQAASLAATTGAETSSPEWRFDLPLQLQEEVETVTMRLWQEAHSGQEEGGSIWRLSLRFELGEWGLVQAELHWLNEQLGSSFWCEQPRTQALLQEQLPVLEDWLTRSGIAVSDLLALQGQAPESAPHQRPPSSGLVDIRA